MRHVADNLFVLVFAGFLAAIFLSVPLAKNSCRIPISDGGGVFIMRSLLQNAVLVYSGNRPVGYPGANMISLDQLLSRGTVPNTVWRNLLRSDVIPGKPILLFNYSRPFYIAAPAEMLQDAGTQGWQATIVRTVTSPTGSSLVWLGSPTPAATICTQ